MRDHDLKFLGLHLEPGLAECLEDHLLGPVKTRTAAQAPNLTLAIGRPCRHDFRQAPLESVLRQGIHQGLFGIILLEFRLRGALGRLRNAQEQIQYGQAKNGRQYGHGPLIEPRDFISCAHGIDE